MKDLIRIIQDFFDLILDFIINLVQGIGTLIKTLAFLGESGNLVSSIFPGYLATLFVVCLTLLIVLRIIGR